MVGDDKDSNAKLYLADSVAKQLQLGLWSIFVLMVCLILPKFIYHLQACGEKGTAVSGHQIFAGAKKLRCCRIRQYTIDNTPHLAPNSSEAMAYQWGTDVPRAHKLKGDKF